MKKTLFFLIMLYFLLFFPKLSQAIIINANPNPATVGQNVTISVEASVVTPCPILIDYGDNSRTTFNCSQFCLNTSSHSYSSPGTYIITASSWFDCNANAPDPAMLSITILQQCLPLNFTSPPSFPSATASQSYAYQLQTSGGQPPITFNLIAGALPPGLTLSASGLVSGTPVTPGNYSFTIEAIDSCITQAQSIRRNFSLNVATPTFSLNVTPLMTNIPRDTSSAVTVLYSFTSTATSNITLRSDRGTFLANNSMIGENPLPLTVSLMNGTGNVSEILNIPVAVLKRAEALGTTRINYTRTFYNPTTSVSGQLTLTITTEALAKFQINRLQLYFDNKRAEITIKRNYPSLKAYAEIRFTGSGLLRGYWEIDGRILSHVDTHLVYGRSITLETPEIPPLPTFDEGTHRLRLVITSPVLDFPVPEAIYFVTSEDYKKAIVYLKLISPEDASEIDYVPVTFRWERRDVTVVYLIEFFEGNDEKPMFSAYTKEAEYLIPTPIHEKLFVPGNKYRWKVKGFDTETNILGESFMNRFIFREN